MPTAEDLSSDVQLKIEALMLDIQQDIMVNRPPKLKVDPISDQATAAGGKRKKTEAMSQYGTKTFASHVAILTYLYEALSRGLTYTTRDVFYRDPELFGSQKAVDDAIVELSNRLQVPRDALGVCAAGKGLVCGPAVGSVSDKLLDSVETRIITRPDDIVFRREHFAQIEAVLIVEKEAIFHQLTQTPVVRYLVLITGKGYPDLATQKLCRKLYDMLQTSSSPTVRATPFFCLVDYDPHGVDILFNYRFGSRKRLFEEQGIPSLRWLGMHWSDVVEAKPHQQVRLIEGEREVLKRLLERPQAIEDGALLAWRRELHRMRMNDIKAEIEIIYDILSKRGQTLDSWLVGLIQQRRFY